MIDTATKPSLASRIKTVRSPRGIEAWLIEDYTVPVSYTHLTLPTIYSV